MKENFEKYIIIRMIPLICLLCFLFCLLQLFESREEKRDYINDQITRMAYIMNNERGERDYISSYGERDILSKAYAAAGMCVRYKDAGLSYDNVESDMAYMGVDDIYVFDKEGKLVFGDESVKDRFPESDILNVINESVPSVRKSDEKSKDGEDIYYAAVLLGNKADTSDSGAVVVAVRSGLMSSFEEMSNYENILSKLDINDNESIIIYDMLTDKYILSKSANEEENIMTGYFKKRLKEAGIRDENKLLSERMEAGNILYMYRQYGSFIIGYVMPDVSSEIFLKVSEIVRVVLMLILFAIVILIYRHWYKKNIVSVLKGMIKSVADCYTSDSFKERIDTRGYGGEFLSLAENLNVLMDRAEEESRNIGKELDENKYIIDEQEKLINEKQMLIELSEKQKNEVQNEIYKKNSFFVYVTERMQEPMNQIVNICEFILLKNFEKEIRDNIIDIKLTAHSMLSMMNDITDITKLESGRFELIPEIYHTESIMHNIVGIPLIKARKKDVEICANIDKRFPAMLYGDAVRVHQAIGKVLNFAVDIADKGRVDIDIKMRKCVDDEVMIYTEIRSFGTGIKSKDPESIFDPYNTDDGFDCMARIGLVIARRLAEMMDGGVEVENRYRKGVKFTVKLVQKMMGEAFISNGPWGSNDLVLENMNSFSAPGARVLVADESGADRKIMTSLLSVVDVYCDECDNIDGACEYIKSQKYDIIFLSEGISEDSEKIQTFINEIMDKDKEISIIIESYDFDGVKERLSGFTEVMGKPIDTVMAADCIRRRLKFSIRGSSLESISGIDVKKGLEKCGQNMEVYRDYLKIFVDNIGSDMEKLRKRREDDNFKEFKVNIGSIKKNAENIGADELVVIAENMEGAAAVSDTYFIDAEMSHFESIIEKTRKEIKDYLGDG